MPIRQPHTLLCFVVALATVALVNPASTAASHEPVDPTTELATELQALDNLIQKTQNLLEQLRIDIASLEALVRQGEAGPEIMAQHETLQEQKSALEENLKTLEELRSNLHSLQADDR